MPQSEIYWKLCFQAIIGHLRSFDNNSASKKSVKRHKNAPYWDLEKKDLCFQVTWDHLEVIWLHRSKIWWAQFIQYSKITFE